MPLSRNGAIEKTNPEKGSSDFPMVELEEVAQNRIMTIDGKVIEVSRNWFCITTLLRK